VSFMLKEKRTKYYMVSLPVSMMVLYSEPSRYKVSKV